MVSRLAAVLVLVLLATGCGSSAPKGQQSPAASAPPAATSAAHSAPAAPADLSTVAVKLQGVPNIDKSGAFNLDQFLQKWSDAPTQDRPVLTQAGFTDGYAAYTLGVMNLNTRTIGDPAEAVIIDRFKSAAGATQVMQAFLAQEKALATYAEFPVSEVSGAVGSSDRQPPVGGGATDTVWRVKFTRGPLFFELLTFSPNAGFDGTSQVVQLAQQQAAKAPAG